MKHLWTGFQALSVVAGLGVMVYALIYGLYRSPIMLIPVVLLISYRLGKFLNELL